MKLVLVGLFAPLYLWSPAALAQPCVEEVLELRREFIEWEKVSTVILDSRDLSKDSRIDGLDFLNTQLVDLEGQLYALNPKERQDDECLVYSHSLHQDLNRLINSLIEGSAI